MYRDLETLWRTTLARNPGCARPLHTWAFSSCRTVGPPKRRNNTGRLLPSQPDYAEAHDNLGVLLSQAGRTVEAEEQLHAALQIRPDYAEAHNNLGLLFMQTGRVPEAMEQYKQAFKIRPDDAEAYNNLGNALMQLGHAPEAQEQYEQP